MGRQSEAIDKLFVLELRNALRSADVDLLCFQRLPLQSELFRELQRMPGLLMKERVPHIFRYSVVPLTAPPGKRVRAFSGKNRREVRRKTRILERAFPGIARFQCFSDPSELEAGLRDAAAVRATTWQHYLGNCALDTLQGRDNLARCSARRWLRIYIMYVEDSPVAFLIGQHYRQTFYCQHAGYRVDFARFSVGSLLTAWALECLAQAGIQQVDLGEGGQEHNRRLGGRDARGRYGTCLLSNMARLLVKHFFCHDADCPGWRPQNSVRAAVESSRQALAAVFDFTIEGSPSPLQNLLCRDPQSRNLRVDPRHSQTSQLVCTTYKPC